MADPKTDGRMIRKDVSGSHKIAALSPEAAVLFFMLIPHYNAHGKMNGGPGYIKDEIVPYIEYFTYENLATYLTEISIKTNVKWFRHEGRWWLHSLKFLSDHQKLDAAKLGQDLLPTYSGVSPDLVESEYPHKEEVEVEVKEEEKEKPDACGKVEKSPETEDEALIRAQQRLVDKRSGLGIREPGNPVKQEPIIGIREPETPERQVDEQRLNSGEPGQLRAETAVIPMVRPVAVNAGVG